MTDPDRALKDAAEQALALPLSCSQCGELFTAAPCGPSHTEALVTSLKFDVQSGPRVVLDLLRRLDAAEREREQQAKQMETRLTGSKLSKALIEQTERAEAAEARLAILTEERYALKARVDMLELKILEAAVKWATPPMPAHCIFCNGSGRVGSADVNEPCPECGGSGKAQ